MCISSLVVRLIARFAFQQAERVHTGELFSFSPEGFLGLPGFYNSANARAVIASNTKGHGPCHPVSPPSPATGGPVTDAGGDALSGGSVGAVQDSTTDWDVEFAAA